MDKTTKKFFESQNGMQLIEAVKNLAEGLKGLEAFFKASIPVPEADSSDHTDTKKRKKRARKDPNAPKHPMSSYLLFSRDNRAAVKELNPTLTPNEVASELGRLWREMSAEQREVYVTEAQALRDQYITLNAEYKHKGDGEPVFLPPGEDSDEEPSNQNEDNEIESSDASSDDDEQEESEEEVEVVPVAPPPKKKAKKTNPASDQISSSQPKEKPPKAAVVAAPRPKTVDSPAVKGTVSPQKKAVITTSPVKVIPIPIKKVDSKSGKSDQTGKSASQTSVSKPKKHKHKSDKSSETPVPNPTKSPIAPGSVSSKKQKQ
ncbi:high mobility group box 3 [Kappamyces sp. JEL0829]|nr:high mobility group box 3 [Kappamyces sp. JEL0829]